MTSAADRFTAAKQALISAREQARIVCREAFQEWAQELFQKHSALESFSWTQYTPYFNDGDECVFSANVDYPDINAAKSWDVPDDSILRQALEDVNVFLRRFDEEDYKELFGDHVEVTVNRKGIDITEYDHD